MDAGGYHAVAREEMAAFDALPAGAREAVRCFVAPRKPEHADSANLHYQPVGLMGGRRWRWRG